MTKKRLLNGSAVVAVAGILLIGGGAMAEPEVELMHMWTSGESANALADIANRFREQGGTWRDNAIAGHTATQYAALRARVIAGDAPTAVQLKGPNIQEWVEAIGLANLDPIAEAGNWRDVIAPALIDIMSYDGHLVAVPINIERVNWMFSSPKALAAIGETEPPKTWAEFNAMAERMDAVGIIPVAHGGQDWQDITIFENVVLGQGLDFYKKSFIELDDETLRGPKMIATFDQLRKMVNWMDEGMPGRDWGETSALVAKGEAGFQLTGDWFVGNMGQLGYVPGTDYVCSALPTTDGSSAFSLNPNSFAFFEQDDPDRQAGQKLLAELIMDPEVQARFNKVKGSLPARMDVDLSDFGYCQQLAMEHLEQSIEADALVPSLAHSIAQPQRIRSSVMEIVSNFMNTNMSSKDAANQVADAVQANI